MFEYIELCFNAFSCVNVNGFCLHTRVWAGARGRYGPRRDAFDARVRYLEAVFSFVKLNVKGVDFARFRGLMSAAPVVVAVVFSFAFCKC